MKRADKSNKDSVPEAVSESNTVNKNQNCVDLDSLMDFLNFAASRKAEPLKNIDLIENNRTYQKNLNRLIKKIKFFQGVQWKIKRDNTNYLMGLDRKWHCKVGEYWNGFAGLTGYVPFEWLKWIDNVLDFIEKYDPGFEIHQIKIKFGRIRFYIQTDLNINHLLSGIKDTLYCEQLQY